MLTVLFSTKKCFGIVGSSLFPCGVVGCIISNYAVFVFTWQYTWCVQKVLNLIFSRVNQWSAGCFLRWRCGGDIHAQSWIFSRPQKASVAGSRPMSEDVYMNALIFCQCRVFLPQLQGILFGISALYICIYHLRLPEISCDACHHYVRLRLIKCSVFGMWDTKLIFFLKTKQTRLLYSTHRGT
jgi:hypothetical protein